MNKIIVILTLIINLTNNYVFSNWQTVYNGNEYIWNIKFYNSMTGFAVGGSPGKGLGLKTTNGGYNWQLVNFNKSFFWGELTGISFLNNDIWFTCGRGNYILKSTNAGNTWREIEAPIHFNTIYNDIIMVSDSIGYAGARYGYIIKTTNGGDNWFDISQVIHNAYSFYFHNELTGFVTDAVSYVYNTTNGGLNWESKHLLDSLENSYSLYKIQFLNQNTGFICGTKVNGGCIFKTTNNGKSWESIYTKNNTQFFDIDFIDVNTGFISAINYIFKTTNSGLSWSEYPQGIQSQFTGIDFINENTGFVTNVNGKIYMNQKNGVNISNEISLITEFKLNQNFPNPFNPKTDITFSIPQFSKVTLKIYDVAGKEVATLVNGEYQSGKYLVTFNGSNFASGVYFYELTAGNYKQTNKMLLVK